MAVAADSHRDFLIPAQKVLRDNEQKPVSMNRVYSFVDLL